uniref:Mediator of RNA polymerase II transcription subunit 4 n=1 Tax=Heterorhabditis bacteriophora TaxID=37862 RepID=A0A1I7XQB5_HETBA
MGDRRSLRDCLLETVDDLDSIAKQVLECLLNRDKHQRGGETLTSLVQLFNRKQDETRTLLQKVAEYRSRELLIRKLEVCVDERNKVIEQLEANLKVAEMAITSAVYQANTKLHSVRESEARPVNSEEVIRLAHQISKSYSVAAPLYWQQGTVMLFFGLYLHYIFLVLLLYESLLRTVLILVVKIVLSYAQASPSPRGGRGGAQWAGRGGAGGVSPFQKRASQV